MIDRTYGHLVAGADDYERELLDAFDARVRDRLDTCGHGGRAKMRPERGPRNEKSPAVAGLSEDGSDGTRTRDLRRDRPAL